jgi:hypothetical protein
MIRTVLGLTIALMLAAPLWVGVRASAAAGGPILPGTAYGPEGVTVPGSSDRYINLFAGEQPLIARVQQDGGQVLQTRSFGPEFAIPAVTLNGDAGGLSADGSTLVLAPPDSRVRGTETTLNVLDAPRLHPRDRITLRGRFTFDAISPDGSRIYLIEYPSPSDTTRYSVRALDTRTARLVPKPIIDPEEPPGEMRGYPLTRANSPDGRWAYTLYDGATDRPFIHALDTVEGRAVCIDLDAIDTKGIYRKRLSVSADGSELTLADRRDGPIALVDTQTFEVREPSEHADGGGFPWLAVAMIPVALVAAWALALVVRRRRRGVAPGDAR